MNEILLALGLESWKPVASALLLPPVPFIVLMLVGARVMTRRRVAGAVLLLLAAASIWLASTEAAAEGLSRWLLSPPPALAPSEIAALKRAPRTAIVVLGAGRRALAPEYAMATLKPHGIERLRYGLWLARETALPLGFSGGTGHGAQPGSSEAEIAARIAEREFGRTLRWTESKSRDTYENATYTVALLQTQGIDQIVLVTHAYHMPRALRNFERASGTRQFKIIAAPLGVRGAEPLRAVDWLPSLSGTEHTWLVLHEWLGLLAGA